jgi:hypothetical protein
MFCPEDLRHEMSLLQKPSGIATSRSTNLKEEEEQEEEEEEDDK